MFKELRANDAKHLKDGIKDICTYVNSKIKVERALEVGTYLGESTCTFIENLPNLVEYIGVDPYSLEHNSDGLFNSELTIKIYDEYMKNMKKYKCHRHIKLPSADASKQIEDQYLDFLYIDGCHQYNSVVKDIENWLPKLKKGGIMSFHDVDNAGVHAAISKFFDTSKGYITQDNSITFEV